MNALLPSQTLVEAVYARIREDIICGRLIADAKLRISELREMYNVGTSPLREALNRLVSEELVVAVGQRGFYVPPTTLAELHDLTETRILIETEALRRSILAGDDAWESSVVGAFHTLSKIEQMPDADANERERRNRVFHAALLSACPLKKLIQVHEDLYDQHRRYRSVSRQMDHHRRDLTSEHRKIMEAALARDVDTAIAATREHIMLTAQVMERGIHALGKDTKSQGAA